MFSLDDESRATLTLSLVPAVGPHLRAQLLDHFGSARDVLAAPPSALRQVNGIGPTLAQSIAKALQTIDAEEEIAHCRQCGIGLVPLPRSEYPVNLKQIPDPPAVLYQRGTLLPDDTLSVAIVGTRHATAYGKRVAARLAGSLARTGLTIVSGLARGIDAEAHRSALEAGGRTVAVLPAGLTQVYPAEHHDLAQAICQSGALVSESPSRTPISRGAFPRRNRIITGLALGVVVVEAGDRSGALISARHAMEQGREVFAVPGPVDSRMSRGCHALLRDGARLVESADDVLEELGPLVQATCRTTGDVIRHPAELKLNDQETLVLQRIGPTATNVDTIIVETGLPVARVLATISTLEMRRLIRRVSGQAVVRA